MGNDLERFSKGYVTDYIKLNFINFPVFNAYDIMITIGCVLYIAFVLFQKDSKIEENENKVIIGFIIISTAIMFILGNPAVLLVLAGAVNGLILPITLAICLIAAHKKSIMGENYHHPVVLTILGVIVVVLTAYLGVTTFVSKIGTLL